MKQQASILKISTECKRKKDKKTDDKKSFVNDYFVSISNGQYSKIRSMNKLRNHLAIPRSIRYDLFSKCNSIREDLTNKMIPLSGRW